MGDCLGWGRGVLRKVLKINPLQGIVTSMNSVTMADLRANLSRYILEVQRGGEIEVLDRGTPVARITSPVKDRDKAWDAMIKAGELNPGNGRSLEILDKPLIKLHAGLSAAVIEDREDRV